MIQHLIFLEQKLNLSQFFRYFLAPLIILFCLFIQPSPLFAGALYEYNINILRKKENASPFLDSIKANSLEDVRDLVRAGCDVNGDEGLGYSALSTAVYKGNIEMIKFLISAGADLERRDQHGNTPLMYAFYGFEDKEDVVRLLLSLNVDVESTNKYEMTPLMLAALNNRCKSLELLLHAGASINKTGKRGTPLMLAVQNYTAEAAQVLIKYGADLEIQDDIGFTPLMYAAFENNGHLLRILIKAGADVHARTTKKIPITIDKDWTDFFISRDYIPINSTALDIAEQIGAQFAQDELIKEGRDQ